MKAERKSVEPIVKTARGQLNAILKMIEDDRYCMDIVTQMLAAEALLRKARKIVFKGHLEGCVQNAMESGNAEERAEKLDEIVRLLEKMEK